MSATPDQSKSHRLPPPTSQQTLSAARWRRRKTATVRLGGRRRSLVWRTGKVFVNAMRRMKLRWMTAQYARAVKKLRNYYAELLKDLWEGAAAMEAAQAKFLSEAYFMVPVLPAVTYYRSDYHVRNS